MKKKNIIYIMTDEQRYDSLSCMGNPVLKNPHMDSIADDGYLFTNSYCTAPLCTPSRVCTFTGQYVHKNGAVGNSMQDHCINAGEFSLLDSLKQEGYKIGLAGKNHCFGDSYMEESFDYREEYFHFGKTHGNLTETDQEIVEYYSDKRREGVIDGPAPFNEKQWTSNRIAEDGIKFVEQHQDQPFFLFYSFPDPHWPNIVSDPHYSMYDPDALPDLEAFEMDWQGHPFKHYVQSQACGFDQYSEAERKRVLATYYGQLAAIDQAIGKMLNRLKELNLEDETIVVFTSDHGNFAGRYGMVGKTGAFYDALLRVPLIIKIPGMKKGEKIQAQVSNIDVLPTLFEALELPIPETVQGVSFLDVLAGEREEHRSAIFAEVGHPKYPPEPVEIEEYPELNKKMVEQRGWKWFTDYVSVGRAAAIKQDDWKYCYNTGDKEELYNLNEDPLELKNLVQEPKHQHKKNELKSKLMDWLLIAPHTKDHQIFL